MTRIICDTMIWYGLASGKLQVPDTKKYQLVCTHLSLTEIAFSSNNFHKLEEVRSVIGKLMSIGPEFITQQPLDYARSRVDSDHTFEYNIEEDLVMAFLRGVYRQSKRVLADGSFKNHLIDIAARRKENSTDWADFQNKLYKLSGISKSILKKYQDNEMLLQESRKWLLFQLSHLDDKEMDSSTDLSDFELYINVYARYIRNLEISNLRADRNDENDLKNMLYVHPTDKY